jgi:HMG (high mobility group) box
MPPKKASAPKAAPKKKSTGGKKKVSGYMLFCKEMRPTILKESPDLAFGAVGKELGKRWKALSDDEKEAYKK